MNLLNDLTKDKLIQIIAEYEFLHSTGILPNSALIREISQKMYGMETVFHMLQVGLQSYRLLYLDMLKPKPKKNDGQS